MCFQLIIIGLKFWKVNSRKFYAIPEEDRIMEPARKRRSIEGCSIDNLRSEVKGVSEKVDKLFAVTKDMHVPVGLKLLLHDAFKCKICLEVPIKPPIIFAKCCRIILGCQACVDNWYAQGGLSKSCPACRADRALAETIRIHGLDELMEGMKEVFVTAGQVGQVID